MTELLQLKRQRGQIKASVTRCKHFYETLDLNNLNTKSIIQLELREKIIPLLDQFNEIQSNIELAEDGDEVGQSEREVFENEYYSLYTSIKETIQNFKLNKASVTISDTVSEVSQPTTDNNTSKNESSIVNNKPNDQVISSNQPLQVQLPIMKLPTFNGDYNKWVEFRDSFQALVDTNSLLSDVQRMHHLRSCLDKEVLETIQSIPVSAANYKIAWDALRERYEKSQLIVRTHVRAILDFPKLVKESAKELRNLYNNTSNNLQALKSLGETIEYWDTLLIPIITDKLDNGTRREWELFCTKESAKGTTDNRKIIKLNDLFNLIKTRCELLEKLDVNKLQAPRSGKIHSTTHVSMNKISCFYCKQNHTIYKCSKFLALSPRDRYEEAQKLRLCLNCLKTNHSTENCQGSTCRKCKKPHNTLLHFESRPNNNQNNVTNVTLGTGPTTSISHTLKSSNATCNSITTQVLLATVMVSVEDSNHGLHQCRALLDNGSMSNFITEDLCKRLNLSLSRVNYAITGVGQAMSHVKYSTSVNMFSRADLFNTSVSCLVLPKITADLPLVSFDRNTFEIPDCIELADLTFNETGSIDLLLGSSVFWDILCSGQQKIINHELSLQNTKLGWIVAGNLSLPYQHSKLINCLSTYHLDQQLSKFWEVEEVNARSILSESEQFCEEYFQTTFRRNPDGKFIVKIPFKGNYKDLGQSRELALKRFYAQERRLIHHPELYDQYRKFMHEYETLGHMEEINEGDSEELNYYLPHHAVVKEASSTTQVRVVFDASMKTDSGISLNDVQHIGPTIQNDLFAIILQFRMYEYVVSADISKMYRMILIDTDQRCFQRIFWRDDSSKEVKRYELKTVTYGTASAPYLAIRCLHQLANENAANYSLACDAIKNNFYVDDFLYGSDSKSQLIEVQRKVSEILSSAGLHLRKWLCNEEELHSHFKINKNLESSVLKLGEANKTLGICWDASDDVIQYSVGCMPHIKRVKVVSKRLILSDISQIFDPLGLLAPVIMSFKLLIQSLWQAKISWDDPVPESLQQNWNKLRDELSEIESIKIPRHVVLPNHDYLELHGFGDASERAYGACVYVRCRRNEEYNSRLLCAKGKVAPIKQLTLPRLELCSAVLLAQKVSKVCAALRVRFDRIYLWSDSTITLSWIRASPQRWKTFVANRVSEIQRLSNVEDWNHVPSRDNPADLLSRGMYGSNIPSCELWWLGPKWLRNDCLPLTSKEQNLQDIPEQRTIANVNIDTNLDIFNRYSCLLKLQRIIAYCFRFCINCKCKKQSRSRGVLTVNELETSLNSLLRISQQEVFTREYTDLAKGKPINSKSNLLALNPYFDIDTRLIRVGGRLQNSNCSFSKKHPIILPAKHKLTKLIFEQEHNRLGHCGPTMLLSSTRDRYWTITGRNIAKGVVRNCKVCFRANPKSIMYLMGNLPEVRVNQYTPFYNTGVDYAGPFLLKDRMTRNAKLIKGYVCLFVCLGTKAVHLEAVSSLTSEYFLATLKRFISRRGKPRNIYSDNGRNFVGACADLKKLQSFLQDANENICNSLVQDRISWHFTPACSPSFGGLWEAGIKSVKYHLKRIAGNAHLNFEEFSTVLTQIEAILNSRPLCPLISDPDELEVLTPGHFLIGKSLLRLPELDYTSAQENRLKRYQRLQQIVQHFWVRWHDEYLSNLQTRIKWKSKGENSPTVDTIVLLKEDNTPPAKWHLGRIIDLHPGKDGVVRVVSVKVKNGIVKRSVAKICPLPNED